MLLKSGKSLILFGEWNVDDICLFLLSSITSSFYSPDSAMLTISHLNRRFLYDGARINDSDTPESLEMEDNGVWLEEFSQCNHGSYITFLPSDTIDVMVERTSHDFLPSSLSTNPCSLPFNRGRRILLIMSLTIFSFYFKPTVFFSLLSLSLFSSMYKSMYYLGLYLIHIFDCHITSSRYRNDWTRSSRLYITNAIQSKDSATIAIETPA